VSTLSAPIRPKNAPNCRLATFRPQDTIKDAELDTPEAVIGELLSTGVAAAAAMQQHGKLPMQQGFFEVQDLEPGDASVEEVEFRNDGSSGSDGDEEDAKVESEEEDAKAQSEEEDGYGDEGLSWEAVMQAVKGQQGKAGK
jgi:hypothetical protein